MRSARVCACLPAFALLALLAVPGAQSARPLTLVTEQSPRDDDWQTQRSLFPGQGGSLLNWLNEQLDSVEDLLSDARYGGSQLQRQDAFREQSQEWVQDVMRQLGGDGMPQQQQMEQGRSDTELGSASQAYSGMASDDGSAQSGSMSIQVEQGPDGSITTTTTTDDGRGGRTTSTSYSSDGSMSTMGEGDGSSSSSSSSSEGSEGSDNSEGRQADVQSAYDEHVAERIQDVRAQLARGEISTAQAEDLMAFFTSQAYLNSWVQQHVQEEQQRQQDLAQVLQQQQMQLLPQELFTGPIFNLMDLLLSPIQSISHGCKHKQQQQQQQQVLPADQQPAAGADDRDQPMMRVTLIHGSSDNDVSGVSSRSSSGRAASGSAGGRSTSYPPWQLCLLALLAGMLALSTLCQAVKYMMVWRRERAELKAHLLDSEACVPPLDVAGAKALPADECAKPAKQQQQPQQQQPQYVSNIVYAKDHASEQL